MGILVNVVDTLRWKGATIRAASTYGLLTTAILVVALFVLPQLWDWIGWTVIILALLVISGVFLIRWHARHTGYACDGCGFRFVVNAWVDFLSPHKAGVKMLRCPRCGLCSWCEEIDRDMIPPEDNLTTRLAKSNPLSATGKLVQMLVVIIIYIAMWLYTLNHLGHLPAAVSTFDAIKLPLYIGILPVLHIVFCGFAALQGYRSRLYPAITGFVVLFMLFAAWTQYRLLTPAG